MTIREELEALRDHCELRSDALTNSRCYVAAGEVQSIADQVDAILARWPRDAAGNPAVLAFDPGPMSTKPPLDAVEERWRVVWNACRHAMLAAEENSDDPSST